MDTCFKFKKRRCADLDLHPLHLVEHGHLRGVVLLVLVDDLMQLLHVNVCRASIAGLHQVNAHFSSGDHGQVPYMVAKVNTVH